MNKGALEVLVVATALTLVQGSGPTLKARIPKQLIGRPHTTHFNNKTELTSLLSEVYTEWGRWSECHWKGQTGTKFRRRLCELPTFCSNTVITEEKPCEHSKITCEDYECEEGHTTRSSENGLFHVVRNTDSNSFKRIGTNLMDSAAGRSGGEWLENKIVYTKWSKWTACTKSCSTQRFKWCKKVSICGNEVIQQTAYCYVEGSYCQKWIHNKVAQEWVVEAVSTNNNNSNIYTNERDHKPSEIDKNRLALQGKFDLRMNCGVVQNVSGYAAPNWNMLRIIGGRPTLPGMWPWQVAVINRFKEAFCGGTLVAPKWVLTAAHCVRKRLYVRVGEYDLAHKEGNELQMRVKKAVIHPAYNAETVDNDVALLRLPTAVPLDKYAIACLPRPRQALPTQQLCTIVGWGKRSTSDMFGTDVLHEAQVPIVPTKMCKEVYDENEITGNMFCAGYRRGRKDSCTGDSGGPLMCRNTLGKWIVFGITSFGEGCGKIGKYGVYTRLPNYVRWIRRVTGISSRRIKPL